MRNSSISIKYIHYVHIVQYGLRDSWFIIMCKCNEKKIVLSTITGSLLDKINKVRRSAKYIKYK
jgi:hypothetical protein